MRRILLSAAMIVFVVAAIVGGTGAFFSDTETSTGNVFAAGGLDLKVDSVAHYNGLVCFAGLWHPESTVAWNSENAELELIVSEAARDEAIEAYNDPALNPMLNPFILAGSDCGGTWELTDLGPEHRFFDYQDLKPGDHGENTISLHVFDNDAYMCAAIHDVVSNENGCTGPEIAAGDVSCGNPGAGEGELDQELNFLIWEDDGNNILEQGEEILYQGLAGDGVAGVYPLYTPANNLIFPGGETKYLGVYWCYGEIERTGTDIFCNGAPVNNMSQTDSLEASISFYVEQARHNENFTCPDLEDFEGLGPVVPTPFALFHDADKDNESEVDETVKPVRVVGQHEGSGHQVGDLFTIEEAYVDDEVFTLEITNGGGNYEFVVTTPFAVSGSDKSMAILIDTDNDGYADFQFEYTNNAMQYKVRNNGGFSNASTPSGYSAGESGGQQVFTFTLPKTDLEPIFKVGVNATHNSSPLANTNLQMGIPEWDIFDGGNWTSSANYLLVDTN